MCWRIIRQGSGFMWNLVDLVIRRWYMVVGSDVTILMKLVIFSLVFRGCLWVCATETTASNVKKCVDLGCIKLDLEIVLKHFLRTLWCFTSVGTSLALPLLVIFNLSFSNFHRFLHDGKLPTIHRFSKIVPEGHPELSRCSNSTHVWQVFGVYIQWDLNCTVQCSSGTTYLNLNMDLLRRCLHRLTSAS